jgi:lysozyme
MTPDKLISESAIKLLISFEGVRLKPYKDSGGRWTVGAGHCLISGELITGIEELPAGGWIGQISYVTANLLLRQDIAGTARSINNLLKVSLAQCQFDGVVLLSFNIGLGNFEVSTLRKRINDSSGNYELLRQAAVHFLEWNEIDGVYNCEQQLRRIQESAWYLGFENN